MSQLLEQKNFLLWAVVGICYIGQIIYILIHWVLSVCLLFEVEEMYLLVSR